LQLKVFEQHGDMVEFGVLSSEAGDYPLVEGIPHFLDHDGEVLGLLRAGRLRDAVAWFAFSSVPISRLGQATRGFAGVRRLRPIGQRIQHRSRNQVIAAARDVLDPGASTSAEPILRLAFLDSLEPSQDAYDYFVHRFAMPRHLVALCFVNALASNSGMTLDVGCGGGHITRSLTSTVRGRVVGVDRCGYLLLAARRYIAPDADYACADATKLPVRDDTVTALFSSDALTFVTDKWSAAREATRVVRHDGDIVLTSLKNTNAEHVYSGEPLSPAGWAGLWRGHVVRLWRDDRVLDSYLAREGLPDTDDLDGVADAQNLSIHTNLSGRELPHDRFTRWPHADGQLALNPLYRRSRRCGNTVVFERHFPSDTYMRDNLAMSTYLPESIELGADLLARLRTGSAGAEEIEPLVGSLVGLGLPYGYVEEPWPTV
jgi:SAM-dependent methyltransferase